VGARAASARKEAIVYAIVQHSGVSTGHAEFEQGLEVAEVTGAQARKVEKVGGIVFGDYVQADDFAERAMFPEGYDGFVPHARGTFSDLEIDGRRVYIPVREVTG
jgi:hypothetical protein